jgi:uncharacterized protein YdeI (YjbR/CyaY-like superfamily)
MGREPGCINKIRSEREPQREGAMRRFSSVDEYIENAGKWQKGLRKLRKVLLASGLEETIKWGAPCYTLGGKNIVGLGAFKGYFGLWFHQGALLPDPQGVLVNAQEGKTKALRQWRFTDETVDSDAVAEYVQAAIGVQKSGKVIKPKRGRPVEVPPELGRALDGDPGTRKAFGELTPGRRREYADYVAEAKRADTKARRIDKILPMIRSGAGLHDRYR